MFANNNSNIPKPLKILFFTTVFFVVASAVIWVVMFLWNTILTEVTNVKPLSFWQAGGLLLLAKILFSGFGGRGKDKWKKRKEWKNKWMAMNDDERQDAKARWKAHCEKKKRE
jgi:hypothetical protein